MAKNKKRKPGFPPPATAPTSNPVRRSGFPDDGPQRRWGLIALFLLVSIGGTYMAIWLRPKNDADRFTFKVLRTFEHDTDAFTQGLVMQGGYLWESTGRYGESTMRKIDLETGKVLNKYPLDDKYFGEGMTWLDGKFYQLTWKEGVAFVYDFDPEKGFQVVKEFKYDGEGWGLTTDGTDLIFSDGSREINFLDPETFETKRSIWVRQPSGAHVGQLNELEYYGGKIYANKYQSDLIYEIDPETGEVGKIIDLAGLWTQRPPDGILNGIAIHPETRRMLVTGKLAPKIYEIELRPIVR